MAFDAEGYRKAAKAAGFSDDEIEQDIQAEMGGAKPEFADPTIEDVKVPGRDTYWVAPAAGAAAGAAAMYGAKKLMGGGVKPPSERIEPTMASPEEAAHQQALRDLELQKKQAEIRLLEARAGKLQPKPSTQNLNQSTPEAVPPMAKRTPQEAQQLLESMKKPAAPPAGAPVSVAPPPALDVEALKRAGVELPAAQQGAPALSPADPEVIAQKAAAADAATKTKTTPKTETKTRVRRTQAQIAADLAAETAAAPPGMRPQYAKPEGGMGPKAFNHLVNNLGLEEATKVWEQQYGQRNVPYKQYVKEYSAAAGKNITGPVKPVPEGTKPGGSFGTPKYIPDYIKGAVSPEMLNSILNKANLATALMTPSTANAPTVKNYEKLQAGRGNVNPKNVDPREWGPLYSEFLKMIQGATGGTTAYVAR